MPTTLSEIRDLAVIDVHSTERPCLSGLIRESKFATYAAVRRGYWPSIKVGQRILIPVPALLRKLDGDCDRASA